MRHRISVKAREAPTIWRLATSIEYLTLSVLFGIGCSIVCTIVISTCNTMATHLFPWYVCFPTGDHLRDIITNFETCWEFPQTVDIDCIRSSCLISAFHLLYFNSASGFLLFSSHLCALSSACSSISARASIMCPDSTRTEGLLSPQHHPQTSETEGSDPTEEMAGIVYQVPCASCPASYVGQTGKCLGKRMKEHRKAVKSGDCANSRLAEHTWSHHHPVDWDKVRVLEQQPHLYHRLILESVHIRSHPHTLNSNNGTLSPVYNSLFFC